MIDASEESRFDELYARHLRALKLQRKAPVRRLMAMPTRSDRSPPYFDRCPDQSIGVRQYGLQHGNGVVITTRAAVPRPAIRCACCRSPMHVIAVSPPWKHIPDH